MVPSVIDYLLQLPEAMHFARVQELCGDGVFFYICFPNTETARSN